MLEEKIRLLGQEKLLEPIRDASDLLRMVSFYMLSPTKWTKFCEEYSTLSAKLEDEEITETEFSDKHRVLLVPDVTWFSRR